MKKILVGTDTSASADLAVGEAARLAGLNGAELLVLHVRTDTAVRDAVDPRKSADPNRYLAEMERRFPSINVRSWSEPGDPAERLVASRSGSRRSSSGTEGSTVRGGGCATAFRTSCSATRPAP
jgi:nucleotide-binding universal stress UspA family protein